MAVMDCIRVCSGCGVQFRRTQKGQPTKYCSTECKRTRKIVRKDRKGLWVQTHRSGVKCAATDCHELTRTRGWCVKHYARVRKWGDPSINQLERRIDRPCAACGKAMRLIPSCINRTCSKGCKAVATLVAKGLGSRLRVVSCHGCGITTARHLSSGSDAGKYCSASCCHRARARVAVEMAALSSIAEAWSFKYSLKVLEETAALRRIASYVERPKVFRTCCRLCDAPFIAKRNGGLRRTRCAACRIEQARKAARISKARRRARILGLPHDSIDPLSVFDRDGWQCRMCGVATPITLRGTHQPTAPELDHIVALALGGSHTWANVQCACRRCNGLKGAMEIGEWLALAA